MSHLLLVLAVALVVGAVVFGVAVLLGGGDDALEPVEPDGRSLPLPSARPLAEQDLVDARFDVAVRGYRMAQVDQALQRISYDLGYKQELINVLEAEVVALRDGRTSDADALQRAREAAVHPGAPEEAGALGDKTAKPAEPDAGVESEPDTATDTTPADDDATAADSPDPAASEPADPTNDWRLPDSDMQRESSHR